MKLNFKTYILIIFYSSFASCINSQKIIQFENSKFYKLKHVSFKEQACGSNYERITIDSLNGILYILEIDCNVSDSNSKYCTFNGYGTHKQKVFYNGKTIIKREIHLPVYKATAALVSGKK
jgi:hypothetical protein